MCAGLKLPLVVGNSPAISVPAFALNRSVCAAIRPCWPRSPPAPSCWPSSSSATLSLGWSWPWHRTPPPTHRTGWRGPRDQASAQCDQQSPSTAASLAILAQSKLPLSLLCLLVSQPTQLGERLHVSMFICSRHNLYLMFFRLCAAGACVLLLRTQARGPPKFIARSAAISLRKFVLNFLDPLHVLGNILRWEFLAPTHVALGKLSTQCLCLRWANDQANRT